MFYPIVGHCNILLSKTIISRTSETLESVEYYIRTNKTGIKSKINSFPYKGAVLDLMKMIGQFPVPHEMSLY